MTAFQTNTSLPCDRETQLRREIVAAMRIRALWRNVTRRQLASTPPSGGGFHPEDSLPRHTLRRSATSGPAAGEHVTRILLISDYDGLRTSCERLLRKHGYDVDAMTSHECVAARELPRFEIAVLCQSVEGNRVPLLSGVLRHHNPGCWLLRVASLLSGIEPALDMRVDGFGGPAVFLAALETLTLRPRK